MSKSYRLLCIASSIKTLSFTTLASWNNIWLWIGGTISSFFPLIINSGDLSLLIFSKLLNLSLIKNFVGKILYRCFAISATAGFDIGTYTGSLWFYIGNQ